MPGFDPVKWNAFLTEGSNPERKRSPFATAAMRRLDNGDYIASSRDLTEQDLKDIVAYRADPENASMNIAVPASTWSMKDPVTGDEQSGVIQPTQQYKTRHLGDEFIAKAREFGRKRRIAEEVEQKKALAADEDARADARADKELERDLRRRRELRDLDKDTPQGRLAQAQYDAIQADIERKAKEAARQSEPINIEAFSDLSPQGKRDFDEYVQRMPEREAYSKAKDNERRREIEAVTELSSMYGGEGALSAEQGSEIEQYISQKGISPDKVPLAIRNRIGKRTPEAEAANAMASIEGDISIAEDALAGETLYLSDADKARQNRAVGRVMRSVDAMPLDPAVKSMIRQSIIRRLEDAASASGSWFDAIVPDSMGVAGKTKASLQSYLGQ